MIYFYVVVGLVVSIPFILMSGGFLYSLTKRGPYGVAWRNRIGLAIDRLVAAGLGFPDKMSICGYVGRRVKNSNNFSWKVYAKIIEALPWWEKGHCGETAEKESIY